MLLGCPSCHTIFRVACEAVGEGRTVCCTRCAATWIAEPTQFKHEMGLLEDEARSVLAAIKSAIETPSADDVSLPIKDELGITENPTLKPETPAPVSEPIALKVEEPIALKSEEPTAPKIDEPIVLKTDEAVAPKVEEPIEQVASEIMVPKRRMFKRRSQRQRWDRTFALSAMSGMLALILFVAIVSRASIVRAVPDLAGLYSAVGLPVNLRGLELRSVRTNSGAQDGIPVLMVEGEIVNVTGSVVEIPRLRIAVLGSDRRELYAWTTQLPRSVLSEGERIPFRSRLASPPAEGREVLVRFINRGDITGSIR
jgi:predicted Zn finger-like uncharacterized protein